MGDNERLVLGGEVYSIRSFGNLINPSWLGGIITQLFTYVESALAWFFAETYGTK